MYISSPFPDIFGVPRHPGRVAILGECSSNGATDDHAGGVDGGGHAEPAASDDVAGAVGAELRNLQRREQRPYQAG